MKNTKNKSIENENEEHQKCMKNIKNKSTKSENEEHQE